MPNKDLDDNKETHLLKGEDEEHDTSNSSPSQSSVEDVEKQAVSPLCFELLTRYDRYPIPIGEPNPKDRSDRWENLSGLSTTSHFRVGLNHYPSLEKMSRSQLRTLSSW